MVVNCTVVSNYSAWASGGVFRSYCVNSIVYFNSCPGGGLSNYWQADTIRMPWTNCCTAPDPATVTVGGANCITVNPMLADMTANCRILRDSPCRNTGTNQPWMNGTLDIDGKARIWGTVVDMGAYEWFPKATIFRGR